MLDKVENRIKGLARRYAAQGDLDDYSQIGRMAAWIVLERHPDPGPALLVHAAKCAMIDEIAKKEAKKRKPEGGMRSLNAPLGDGGSRSLEDVIGEDDLEMLDVDDVSITRLLREKYGHFYTTGLKAEKRPKEIVRNMIRVAIEDLEGIPVDDIPSSVSYSFFEKHKLVNILRVFYDDNPFKAVSDAYGGRWVPWEFKRVPRNYWSGKDGYIRAVEAIHWFTSTRGITSAEQCRKVSIGQLYDAGLSGALQIHFNASTFLAFQTVFPAIRPWQTAQAPNRFFDSEDNRREAAAFYLQQNGIPSIFGLSDVEVYEAGIRKVVSKASIIASGLRGLLDKYGGNVYKTFKTLFPEKIHPWFINGAKSAWKHDPIDTAAHAVRWLFEQYLAIPLDEIPACATIDLFGKVGFSGILSNPRFGFNTSPYALVDNAYPGVFSKGDFNHRGNKSKVIKIDTSDMRRVYS